MKEFAEGQESDEDPEYRFDEKNNKDRISVQHYKKIFSELNPIEAAGAFAITV
jgi:hypothetical protein